jgi:hypothetical protein
MNPTKIKLNNNDLRLYQSILNNYMPKQFPWWIESELINAYLGKSPDNKLILFVNQKLRVNLDWANNKYNDLYSHEYFKTFNPEDNYNLGDVLSQKEMNNVNNKLEMLFKMFYDEYPDATRNNSELIFN